MPVKISEHDSSINGVNYHWIEAGEGSSPLVMLHGFTGSSDTWSEHLPVFAENRRVIAVDLLGHGKTDSPPDSTRYSIEHAAADLLALCDSLSIEKLSLFGYSMGGRLALYFALTYPERIDRLILESTSPGIQDEVERAERVRADNALANHIANAGIPAFVTYWEHLPLFETQRSLPLEVRRRIREQRLANNPVGLANSLRGMGTGVQPSLWRRLREVKAQTQVIVGELDHKFTGIALEMVQAGLTAQIMICPRAGHTPHLEQTFQFQHAVTTFL